MKAVFGTQPDGGLDRRDAAPLALMVLLWVGVVIWSPPAAHSGDVLRFVQIAHGGTPYVDQQIEYPPLETALIFLVGASSITATAIFLALVNAVATIGCWLLLRTGWSASVGRTFLWFALPLQVFMPFRLDAVSVVLALGGIVLATRHRQAAGGSLLGAAVLFKLWPIVLVPLLVVRRLWRSLSFTAVVIACGTVLWAATFGLGALSQVGNYRGASGWQIESVFGAVVRLTTGAPIRIEAGAIRIGQASRLDLLGLRAMTLVLVAFVWFLSRRRPVDPAGGPALASVAFLLLLSPVASPQYVVWLLPWAAIAAAERGSPDIRIFTIGATIAASGVFAIYWGDPYNVAVTTIVVLAIVRAVCILALAVIGLAHRSVTRSDAPLPVDATVPVV
jgi:Glycosyltransferase family 87